LNLDPAKVIKEGGSGFAKVISALLYEFKQKAPRIEVVEDPLYLRVTVICDLTSLAA
jgi:hypothetical protein